VEGSNKYPTKCWQQGKHDMLVSISIDCEGLVERANNTGRGIGTPLGLGRIV